MSDLLLWTIVLGAALLVLLKASEFMNQSAERIGLTIGIPPFIIGVVLLAFGTSLPELLTTIFAMLADTPEIVLGNVVGSNITNVFLIMGIIAIVKRDTIHFRIANIHTDIYFFIGSALFTAMIFFDREYGLAEGIMSLMGFGAYLFYIITDSKSLVELDIPEDEDMPRANWRDYLIFLAALVALFFSADYAVLSVIEVSKALNIGSEVIATSAVALGTSLPELVVSLDAVKNNKPEMALGNILGSSIFNLFLITGVASLFGSLQVTDFIFLDALPIMLIATFLCFLVVRDRRLNRYEGMLFLLFYLYFNGRLLGFV